MANGRVVGQAEDETPICMKGKRLDIKGDELNAQAVMEGYQGGLKATWTERKDDMTMYEISIEPVEVVSAVVCNSGRAIGIFLQSRNLSSLQIPSSSDAK